tara:strand:- start:718 stop:1038 length:321 start_codon:yes stop_codon:yes gene_type:complete
MDDQKNKKAYRQGDVILICDAKIPEEKRKLCHSVLAEGEVTGHKHQVTEGDVELYEDVVGGIYLKVFSLDAKITHEEHGLIKLPKGDYEVRIQREYDPIEDRYVID